MKKMISVAIPILMVGLSTTTIFAQKKQGEGKKLYELHCAACHAVNGEGATGGAFPPLAGSEWLLGDAKRATAIILKGITGPITVRGRQYNLVMPPHEATLNKRQISDILNYVNSAWGNRGPKVRPDIVLNVREEFASRSEPWTAPELIKLYPLPKQETPIKNLLSHSYKGKWEQLPDFKSLKAESVEEEADGLIDVAVSPHEQHFGIVWEGDFMAKEKATHHFYLDADDGARITINGKVIAEINEIGLMDNTRSQTGKIDLEKGKHSIRVEYFQHTDSKAISIGWKTNPKAGWKWVTPSASAPQKPYPDIFLKPTNGQATIYRNFIEGTTPRAIGVGFPNGTSMAYSADNLAPEILWKGDFINAGRHWTNRGQGNEPPASDIRTQLTKKRFLPEEARFKGYTLDAHSNPTFNIQIGDRILTDSWKPGDNNTLIRTLNITGKGEPLTIPSGSKLMTGTETITIKADSEITVIYKFN
jgi:mono/diheme cytochrome c family protein